MHTVINYNYFIMACIPQPHISTALYITYKNSILYMYKYFTTSEYVQNKKNKYYREKGEK